MKQKLNVAMTLAVIFSLLMTSLALADNVITDGDGLTPIADTGTLDLGNVCVGSTITKPILHAISRNGNYPSTNVFANSATVSVSVSQVIGSGLSALEDAEHGEQMLPSHHDNDRR